MKRFIFNLSKNTKNLTITVLGCLFSAFSFHWVCSLYVWMTFPWDAEWNSPNLVKIALNHIACCKLVKCVYKPKPICVGWVKMTESCLEACMYILHACLDEFPPGHPTEHRDLESYFNGKQFILSLCHLFQCWQLNTRTAKAAVSSFK